MFTVLAVVDSSHDDGSLYPIKGDDDDVVPKFVEVEWWSPS